MAQGFTRGTPIDTDPNLSLDSDLVVPSQKAIKDYVDTGLNTKQDTLTLTTTGTSGAATLIGATLNIPQYSGGGPGGDSIGQLTGDVDTVLATSPTEVMPSALKANLKTGSFGVTVDGVTTVIQPGQTGFVVIPYSGTITGWSITANVAGNIQFDVWKDALPGVIPVLADSIITSNFPTLSGTNFNTQPVTGVQWTTAFAAGDIFGFYVNSASTIKNATLTIRTTKS
jgi:hypothetical protein